jgi:hypothetical protein
MIWYCAAAKNCPLTPSMFSIALSSILSLSFRMRRSLVAQCSAVRMFAMPPMWSRISRATRSSAGIEA